LLDVAEAKRREAELRKGLSASTSPRQQVIDTGTTAKKGPKPP
jgi:hypothetical protein